MMTDARPRSAPITGRISPWYSGLAHVVVISAIGSTRSGMHPPHSPAELARLAGRAGGLPRLQHLRVGAAPLLMHRPVKGFMGIYQRHTLAHHQFFTDHEPTIDTTRDFRITFFPPYALTTFICMSARRRLVLGWLWSANAGWLLVCTTTAVPQLRAVPLGLPCQGRPHRPPYPVREHDPAPPHRASRPGDHDGAPT